MLRKYAPILVYFMVTQKLVITSPCRRSEFACKNSQCINLDHFCNGVEDCEDHSDEPPTCTRKWTNII